MGISNILHGRKMLLASAAVLLPVAAPAIGHADQDDIATYAAWTTSVADDSTGDFCTMHTTMQDGGVFSVIANTHGVWIRATDTQWDSTADQNIGLDVDVDGQSFTGGAYADGENTIETPVGTALLTALEDGQQAVVHIGTEYSWTLDLTGTADATYALSRCLNALQNS
jgi:hypothetical protein